MDYSQRKKTIYSLIGKIVVVAILVGLCTLVACEDLKEEINSSAVPTKNPSIVSGNSELNSELDDNTVASSTVTSDISIKGDFSLTTSSKVFQCFPESDLGFIAMGDDGVYYSEDAFGGGFYYLAQKSKNTYKRTLLMNDFFSEVSSLSGMLQPVGSDAYYVKYDTEDWYGDLFRINVKTKKKEKLSPSGIGRDWTVSGNAVVFEKMVYDESDDCNYSSDLYYQLFDDSDATLICRNMRSFAVCDNKVRYTIREGNAIAIYEFDLIDKTQNKLCSLIIENSSYYFSMMDSDYIVYSDDYAVLHGVDGGYDKKVFVCSIDTGVTQKYEMPNSIDNTCCVGSYAFLATDGGLYRLNPVNGDLEKIFDMTKCDALYVIDESSFCGLFLDDKTLPTQCYVYKFSVDGIAEKVFQY